MSIVTLCLLLGEDNCSPPHECSASDFLENNLCVSQPHNIQDVHSVNNNQSLGKRGGARWSDDVLLLLLRRRLEAIFLISSGENEKDKHKKWEEQPINFNTSSD